MSDIQKQIAALNAQVNILDDSDPKQAYELCLSAYQLAVSHPDEVDEATLAQCLHSLGYLNYRFGHYTLAQQHMREALPLLEETGDRQNQATTLRFLGLTQWRLGNYPEMLNYHYRAIELYQRINDQHGEAISLSDIGVAYFHIHDFLNTLDHFQRSLCATAWARPWKPKPPPPISASRISRKVSSSPSTTSATTPPSSSPVTAVGRPTK